MPRKPLSPDAAGARFAGWRRAGGGGLEGSRTKAGGWPQPDQQDRKPKPSPGMDAGGNAQGRGNPARRGGMKGLDFGERLNFDIF